MTKYTAKETETIRSAYAAVERIIDETDMTVPFEWKQALKAERSECGSITAAKALLVENFTRGAENPELPAREVYRFRAGCRMALMIGATVATRRTGAMLEKSRELRAQAIAAHHTATKRELDKPWELA